MNEPKSPRIDREQLAQAQALQAGAVKDARSRDYQRIYAAVAAAPLPALPADLAQRILTQVENLAETARTERWMTTILLVVMAVGCLFYAGPSLIAELSQVSLPKAGAWPVLAAAGLVGAVVLDRWSVKQRGQRW